MLQISKICLSGSGTTSPPGLGRSNMLPSFCCARRRKRAWLWRSEAPATGSLRRSDSSEGELTDRIMRESVKHPRLPQSPPSRHAAGNRGLAFLISLRSPGFILAFCFFVGSLSAFTTPAVRWILRNRFPRFIAYAMDISHVTD